MTPIGVTYIKSELLIDEEPGVFSADYHVAGLRRVDEADRQLALSLAYSSWQVAMAT